MITIQKILFLRHVPLFAGMPPDELSTLAGIAAEIVYSTGQTIIHQGEHGSSMFLIVQGKVRIHQGNVELAILKQEDYFGEMSILDGEPRSASATALTDCLLLCIDQADFHDILTRHAGAALTIIQTLTQRLRDMAVVHSVHADNLQENQPDETKS
ncbi:MAG: cyclic nucleotide-binding domain-containing protein [bacterium]|nr:cyclic nucleotide-binding domain-containing protein [bacterium]